MTDEDAKSAATPAKRGLLGRLFGGRQEPDTGAAPGTPPEAAVETAPPAPRNWWARLKDGLARSSASLGQGISDVNTKRKLDAAMLDDLADILIQADLGVGAATTSAVVSASILILAFDYVLTEMFFAR